MRVFKTLSSSLLLALMIPILAIAAEIFYDKNETFAENEASALSTAEAEVARLLEEAPRVRECGRGAAGALFLFQATTHS